jgi:ABC-type oligopeptide transport system substrate-binding subunit
VQPPSAPWRITAVRVALGLVLAGGFALCTWGLAEVAPRSSGERRAEGKPGKKKERVKEEEEEEREDAKKPKRRTVDSIDVEDVEEKKPERPAPAPVTDLAEAAKEARHAQVGSLFSALAVPYDRIKLRGYKRVTKGGDSPLSGKFKVEPIAQYADKPRDLTGRLTLQIIDETGKQLRKAVAAPADVIELVYYEQWAAAEVSDFLKLGLERADPEGRRYLSRYDQLLAAEQALSAVVRFHDSARSRGVRKGKGWAVVEKKLRRELLAVLLEKLRVLADGKKWDEAFALTRRLAQTYTDLKDHAAIAKPLAELLKKALNDPTYTEDKMKEARQRLRLLEEHFPDSEVIKPITESLHNQAKSLFKRAKEVAENKERTLDALALLKQAEEAWPQMPGLRTFRMELDKSYQALRVGVRELPRYMSPAQAVTDTELRAVELLFESLVKVSPDEKGVLFHRPGLALGRPRVIPLGREFRLPRGARWSDGKELSLGDVRYTLGRLQKGVGTGRSAVWGDLLGEVKASGDPYRIKLLLRQGYLNPLALMTFKVLPYRTSPDPASKTFAKKPISSGPFRYDRTRSDLARNREYARFVANPDYGARPGKFALPRVKEIRFVAIPKTVDPAKELLEGELEMALDLTADQAADLRDRPGIVVPLPADGPPNRRIYFLAVNHRKPVLEQAALRVALARAINRERLLDEHFRGKLGRKVHRALNGPYPAKSWACNPELKSRTEKNSLDPYDVELARAKLAQSKAEKLELTLKYPSGDPALAEAMKALCKDVSEALKIKLKPVELDPRDLRRDIQRTDFQLAYCHYDFPDETFWLKPLLGTSSRAGGGNLFGYTGGLVGKIEASTGLRHFTQVRKYAHVIHRDFLEREMPFIPLWQLDPLLAYRSDGDCKVEVVPFDPQLVFTDVEQWRVVRNK